MHLDIKVEKKKSRQWRDFFIIKELTFIPLLPVILRML